MQFTIETEREKDGRWIAEIPEVPGALAYGATKKKATTKARAIAMESLVDHFRDLTDMVEACY